MSFVQMCAVRFLQARLSRCVPLALACAACSAATPPEEAKAQTSSHLSGGDDDDDDDGKRLASVQDDSQRAAVSDDQDFSTARDVTDSVETTYSPPAAVETPPANNCPSRYKPCGDGDRLCCPAGCPIGYQSCGERGQLCCPM
jgi:hypothetical protein